MYTVKQINLLRIHLISLKPTEHYPLELLKNTFTGNPASKLFDLLVSGN